MTDGYFTPETDPWLYRCRCGRPKCDAATSVHPTLLSLLNELRYRVGRPIPVISGNRCEWWNAREGGVDGSEHVDPGGTLAADLGLRSGRERYELLAANFTKPILFKRLGIGPDFLHVGASISHPLEVCWSYYGKKARA